MKILRNLVFARHDPLPSPGSTLGPNDLRTGAPLDAKELRANFGNCIVGTNAYFGINRLNERLGGFDFNTAPTIQSWLDLVQPGQEFTLMLGVEPNTVDDEVMVGEGDARRISAEASYSYVRNNLDIVRQLGGRLDDLIRQCEAGGATMRCVVRYASEMNRGTGNGYSGRPQEFKDTYATVHGILKKANPKILLSFAPGIGSFSVADVDDYWPGDGLVDLVGCTWYFNGGPDVRDAAKANLDAYFRKYASPERPPCVDELGGTVDKGDPLGRNESSFANLHDHLRNL